MVTFTGIPYAEAARRARIQHAIIYSALILIAMSILALSLFLTRVVLRH